MRVTSNRVVCDLKKVQWAHFGYVNQYDQLSEKKPKFSVHGFPRDPDERALTKVGEPTMTLKQMADVLKITDVWTPRIKLVFASNHTLVYTGQKAVNLNAAWNARVFKQAMEDSKRDKNRKK